MWLILIEAGIPLHDLRGPCKSNIINDDWI